MRQLPIDLVLGEDFLFDQNHFDAGDPTLVISHIAISGGVHFFAGAAHFIGALDAFGAERLIDGIGENLPVGKVVLALIDRPRTRKTANVVMSTRNKYLPDSTFEPVRQRSVLFP